LTFSKSCRCCLQQQNHQRIEHMSRSKLEIVQARQSRGEELRLGFILAAMKAARPLKLASGRKGSRRPGNARLEAAAA
jgi:hypothetical protein